MSKNYHLADEAIKLTKNYFNNFDKTVQRIYFNVLQYREKIIRKIKTIIAYILDDLDVFITIN